MSKSIESASDVIINVGHEQLSFCFLMLVKSPRRSEKYH